MKKLLLAFIVSMMIFQVSALAAINGKSVKSFVERFYVTVLDREADIPGLMDWTNNLTTGISAGSDVATGFVFSAEFINRDTSDIEFLNILYQAFFNRTADAGGLAGWLDQLTQGTSREEVLNGFLYSQEFSTLAAAYGIKAVPDGSNSSTDRSVEEFVSRFYSVVLGRTADAGGLADWVNRLNTKVATGADIAIGFVFSTEFDAKSKDDVTFLNVLYSAFFNRAADEGGLNSWLSQLEQGTSREDVLNGFLHSQEFVNLCNSYHIKAYEGALVYKLARVIDDNLGSVEEYTYDEQGRLIIDSIVTDYSTETTTYRYDTNGQLLEKIFLDQFGDEYGSGEETTITTYEYNANGNLLSDKEVTTISGGSTTFGIYTYDTKGRKISVTYTTTGPDGFGGIIDTIVLEYTYTTSGKTATVKRISEGIDEFKILYNYDGNGILLSEMTFRFFDGIETKYTEVYYDIYGNEKILFDEVAETDIGALFYGSKTYDAFDPLGNIVLRVFELWGNLGSTYYTYTYDENNNMTSRSSIDDFGTGYTITYEWVKIP